MLNIESRDARRFRFVSLSTALGVAAMLALTSCATPNGIGQLQQAGSVDQSLSVDLSSQTQAWEMPLDAYRVRADLSTNYAEHLAIQPCLETQGYQWPVPWQDPTELPSTSMSQSGARVFNLKNAEVAGYHLAPNSSLSTQLWDTFRDATALVETDPEFKPAYDECLSRAREIIPPPSIEDQLFVAGLARDSSAASLSDENVVAAGERWAACMQAAGIAEATARPHEMPSEEMTADFGLRQGLDSGSDAASPEEIKIAVSDARCADDVGYTDALYRAQWALQSEAIANNRDHLETIKAAVQAQQSAADEVIRELAPERP